VKNGHPRSSGGTTLVILDACVLLPSRLSDVLFDLMLEGLYFAYWTGDVEAEFLRNWPVVHPDAAKSGPKRLKAFQRATNNGHLISGYDDEAFMSRVPARVHKNDRHLVAAALVLTSGLDEEDDPTLHKVLIVSDNTKHLAVADTRKLGIEVVKAGAFLDGMFEAEPQRSIQAISKSLSDLKKPPYSRQEMLAALRLHGARATAAGLAQSWAVEEKR
jgi:hypothetical protein